MAEENRDQALNVQESEGEVKDRDFHFFGKKDDAEEKKPQYDEEVLLTAGVERIQIDEGHKAVVEEIKEKEKETEKEKEKEEEKKHMSHSSSSSSSSDEEEVEGEGGVKEKIKKKKGLKAALEEKLHGGEKKEKEEAKEPTFVPVSYSEETKATVEKVDVPPEEEKKGFLEKIKDKLPGHGKKASEESGDVPPPAVVVADTEDSKEHEVVEGPEGKEKKGFLEKIMDKLPGYHKNTGDDVDHKNPSAST